MLGAKWPLSRLARLTWLVLAPLCVHGGSQAPAQSLFQTETADGADVADGVAYVVEFQTGEAGRSVRSTIISASNLEILKKSALPSGAAGLLRRAQADQDRIVAALYEAGHYAGRVDISIAGVPVQAPSALERIEAARAGGPVAVIVAVDAGPEFKFGRIQIVDAGSGRPVPDVPSHRALRMRPGEVAAASAVIGAEKLVIDFLRSKGHALAKVVRKEVVADHQAHTLDVTFLVQPGPVARFGNVKVSGAKTIDAKLIGDRITIRPGEPYSPERLARLRKQLAAYEILGGVRIREGETLDATGQLPVFVEVSEREARYVGAGAKYSNTDGSSINAYWGHRNLFGGGETLRLDAQLNWFGKTPDGVPDANPLGGRVAVSFAKPGIWSAQDDFIAQAAGVREVTTAYVRDAATLLTGGRRRIDDQLSVQTGLDVEQAQLRDASGRHIEFITGLPIDMTYDTTKSPLDPARGVRANATVEPFAYLGQSGAGPVMVKGTLAGYHAFDVDARYIFAARVGAGSLFGTSLLDVPIDRRFFVGGGSSLRGFDYQSASPRDAAGNIIGGLSYTQGSAELRVKLTDSVGVVPFFDIGSAYRTNLPNFDNLKYSAGLGLRYYTPVGPVRLDVAVPVNPRPGNSKYGVYISLGQAF